MEFGKETYLADGVYASFDGYSVILRAPREHGDHWVALEPLTMSVLMRFLREINFGRKPS